MKYPTIRIEGAILAADILDKIEKSMDRDNFMSADEAQKFGLIDKVVEAHALPDKEDK